MNHAKQIRTAFARYEDRRKAERDRASEIRDAEERGQKKGIDRGAWIGQIEAYERVLKLPVSSREDFDNVPLEDLIARANRLAKQVQAGGGS